MKRIAISAGHGLYVRGASGSPIPPCLDEVDEARRVVQRVTTLLRSRDVGVAAFYDDTSKDQQTNLETIVAFHNSQERTLDVSCHFNAFDGDAHGVEVCYLSQEALARELSAAIAAAGGFKDRGPKLREGENGLYFLNHTDQPAVLIEVAFCDNIDDSTQYRNHFDEICEAIADVLAGEEDIAPPDIYSHKIPDNQKKIIASMFGGEDDYNVSAYDENKVLNDTDFYVALPDRFEG
jgi:N-acetylmuramoyl-L-alanine amidase